MKKKGFTLIELLAVIVILAIIALIATPIVMNVIENSRKGAAERSAENYIDAVELAIASKRLDGEVLEGEYTIQSDGNLVKDGKTINIDMSGNKPKSGTIYIENGQVVDKLSTDATKATVIKTKDDYTVSYNAEGELVATKEQAGSATVTVYRWSKDTISIEQEIDPTDTTKFTTDPTTLGKNVYLKHVVENNIVKESYACAVFNIDGKDEEVCVQGGNPNYYGYAENEANYAGNALILKGLQDEDFGCYFNANNSGCYDGSVYLYAYSNGDVNANDDYDNCYVSGVDGSACES